MKYELEDVSFGHTFTYLYCVKHTIICTFSYFLAYRNRIHVLNIYRDEGYYDEVLHYWVLYK